MRFHAFLVVLLISRTCDNSLENHGRNEHHIFFIFVFMKFFLDGDGTCCFHTVFYSVLCFSHDIITPPPHPPSVNNNETFNVTPSSNQATSSRIQHHPTHFTWRYYTPPHPHPPPISIQERPLWYSIKTEGSSKLRGTPSLEPIYIYITCILWYVLICSWYVV